MIMANKRDEVTTRTDYSRDLHFEAHPRRPSIPNTLSQNGHPEYFTNKVTAQILGCVGDDDDGTLLLLPTVAPAVHDLRCLTVCKC